jgi:uncharacterized protein
LFARSLKKKSCFIVIPLRSICKQGFQYYRANGVERDYGIAFKYFSAAADGGDEIGLYRLGLCYSWGHGVAQNDNRAFGLFSLSGAKGYAPPLHYLGISFNCRLGTPKDVEKAFDYFLKAAEQGLPDAQEAVTGFLMEGTAGVKDPARGIRILNSR